MAAAPPMLRIARATGILLVVLLLLAGGVVWFIGWPERTPAPVLTPLADQPVSSLNVPVTVHLGTALDVLDPALPKRFGDPDTRQRHPADRNLQYTFEAERGPLNLAVRNDTLHLTTTVQYRSQVWYTTPFGFDLTASCGQTMSMRPPPRAQVHLTSHFHIDSTWTLRPDVEVQAITPIDADDRCIVSLFNQDIIDATTPILSAAEVWLQDHRSAFNEALAATPIRPSAERTWEQLHAPIAMGSDTWLTLHPQDVRFATTSTDNAESALRMQVMLDVKPQFTMGNEPQVAEQALPSLKSADTLPTDPLTVDARVSYPTLSAALSEAVVGHRTEIAGRTVRIDSVSASAPEEDRLALSLRLDGSLQGHLHVTGTPLWNADTRTIRLSGIETTFEGVPRWARAGGALLPYLPDRMVQEHTQVSLSALLDRLEDQLAPLDHPIHSAHLTGTLSPPVLTDLRATTEALVVRAHTTPHLHLHVGAPPPSHPLPYVEQ